MDALLDGLVVVAMIANGLLAGLFFVFANAICPGFRAVDDSTYVRAFRAINSTILNGWFLSVFFVAPLSAVAAAALRWWSRSGVLPVTLLVAAAICSASTFVITSAGNVPLNQELDRANIGTEQQRSAARGRFEEPWNRWNRVRTATSVGALALLAIAAVQ